MFGLVVSKYLLRDKNSTLSIGFSINSYSVEFGKSAGSGDGTNGIKSESLSAYGLDIGILASLREKNRIGVFIKNINSSEYQNLELLSQTAKLLKFWIRSTNSYTLLQFW